LNVCAQVPGYKQAQASRNAVWFSGHAHILDQQPAPTDLRGTPMFDAPPQGTTMPLVWVEFGDVLNIPLQVDI